DAHRFAGGVVVDDVDVGRRTAGILEVDGGGVAAVCSIAQGWQQRESGDRHLRRRGGTRPARVMDGYGGGVGSGIGIGVGTVNGELRTAADRARARRAVSPV